MGLVREFNRVWRLGTARYRRSLASGPRRYVRTEEVRGEGLIASSPADTVLVHGDNREVMAAMLAEPDIRGRIQMIYTDPPFFSMADYDAVLHAGGESIKSGAYRDSWGAGMAEYLKMLTPRLMLMRDLLAEDGLMFLHLDWHAVQYVRVIMDEIFGEKNFVNEVIWQYKSGGSGKRHFARKHDNILVYAKGKNYRFFPLTEKSYNRGFKPYRFKGVREYQDARGWYTMVNMKDVWHIDMVGRTSAERTGYATQKPEELVSRIISCSTKEGDLVADFFSGSGTLGAAAAKAGRRSIMVDSGRLAVETSAARLIREGIAFSVYEEDRKRDSVLRAGVDIEREEDPSGEIAVTVSITGIKLRTSGTDMDEARRARLELLLKERPLDLILSWSVDFDFDGRIHRPDVIFVREGKKLQTSCRRALFASTAISVKITDVFGNTQFVRREG